MAICKCCGKDMLKVDSCIKLPFVYEDGESLDPLKYGEDWVEEVGDLSERCHDCNCNKGNYHHRGCDMERCPRCQGQALSCDCELKEE